MHLVGGKKKIEEFISGKVEEERITY